MKDQQPDSVTGPQIDVGSRIRALRNKAKMSLKFLSASSGLNINTLSLIENGKSSPSVSTLQQLSRALEVPMTAFFEMEPKSKKVVFTPANENSGLSVGSVYMLNLGKDLSHNSVLPFEVKLDIAASSGEHPIIHTGYEFVYCLEGCIEYQIEDKIYPMDSGDSLVFEARLPHLWRNRHSSESRILLIFVPMDQNEKPDQYHFQES